MSAKGKTRWYPRHIAPVRNGIYECIVRLCPGFNAKVMVEWDGIGFKWPMPVYHWRGQTKKAAHGIKGDA